MKRQPEPVTRDNILKILSDEEVANIALPAMSTQLEAGDEFIDLAEIDCGVQRATESQRRKDVLARKAVHEHAWRKVVTNLVARQLMAQPPPPPPPRYP